MSGVQIEKAVAMSVAFVVKDGWTSRDRKQRKRRSMSTPKTICQRDFQKILALDGINMAFETRIMHFPLDQARANIRVADSSMDLIFTDYRLL